jgi:DNA repair protein RecN (Recombination protein N)
MIRHLRIRDFILIDELELELDEGFYALTGETGAGKSVLARAVELLRGGRARADVIRAGAEEAIVEAILEPGPGSSAWPRLREAGLPDGEGQLVVRRVVAAGGRGRVYLNGVLATGAQLGEIVGPLIDVASQHEHQSLGEVRNHLEALDAFGKHGELRERMTAAFEAMRAAEAEVSAAQTDARTRAEREDFLKFQLAQIDEIKPTAGEETELAKERDRLRSAEKLGGAARRGEEALYAGDAAAADAIAGALRELTPLAAIDDQLTPMVRELEEARAQIEDAAFRLRRYADAIAADPERLAAVEERLDALGRLLRKHGPDLVARRAEMAAELAALERHEERRAQAEKQLAQARAEAMAAAHALSEARRKAAKQIVKRVGEGLREMQMAGARIEVHVEAEVERLGPTGIDRVEFLIAANPGEPMLPLARVASGGELSRVMLALKLATADADAVATYVFDEVDAGVGGGVAEKIGRLVREVARHRQVLCITHLPQIAAFADVHLRVEKKAAGERTVQLVERLDGASREKEIARMMAGVEVTAKARAHAAEMLRQARAGK